MSIPLHTHASVGSLIKKLLAVNPELSVQELAQIIRQATRTQHDPASDFGQVETVDESKALALVKRST